MRPNLQQPQISIRKKRSFKKRWVLLPLLATYIATIVWYTNKPLPKGVSYEGEVHRVQNVDFLFFL